MVFFRLALILSGLFSLGNSIFAQENPLINPAETILQADILYDSGKYSDAIGLLGSIPPRDTAYHQIKRIKLLAYSYISNGQYDSAIEICNQLLKIPSPDRSMLLRIRAFATDKKGDYKGAVALYKAGINEYPLDVDMAFGLALIQFNNKDFKDARDNFLRVLAINPFCSSCHLNLAKLGIGLGMRVHAMMAMGMYLSLNEKDNANLVYINKFLDNQVSDAGSFPTFGTNAAEKLDQIIRARLVFEEGYKSMFPIDAAVVRQYELLFDQLEAIPLSTDDKYIEYYMPIYKAIKENGGAQAFIYHMLTSSDLDEAHKWRKKNEKDLTAFYTTANEVMKSKRANIVTPEFNYKSAANAWYTGNQLASIGNYENEKRIGRWVYFHDNSEIQAEGRYNDKGRKTGTWTYHHNNGRTKSIENYDTNEVTVYSRETGNKAEHFFLKNDNIHGDVELFYEGGAIREKLRFADGKKEGTRNMYFPDGQLEARYEYVADQVIGPYVINHESGQVKERCSYKEGFLDGKYEYFHFNGTLSSTGTYAAGNPVGQWEYYYSNGKPHHNGNYNNKGRPIGEWKYFNFDGELIESRKFDEIGQFQGDNSFYDNGKLTSVLNYKKDVLIRVTYYNETGKVISTSGNADGTFSTKNYFTTGELHSEGNYLKGKIDGEWKYYDRVGLLVSKYFYKDGELDGAANDYYPTGVKKYEVEYKDGNQHGYFKEFYSNGKTKLEGWVQDGNREQRWLSYFSDGTIESDYYYIGGKQNGVGYNYAVDGLKNYEVYENDEGVSYLQYYNSKGEKSSVMREDGNATIFEEFFNNKILKSRHDVAGGSYVRATEQYFSDGNLYFKYELANGKINGQYEGHDIDGRLIAAGSYAIGNREGKWKRFHENGKLANEGNYVNDDKDSIWTYYYPNGIVSSRAAYKDDIKAGISTFYGPDGTGLVQKLYANGDVIAYRPYVDDQANAWVKFTGNGKIVINYPNSDTRAFEEEYVNGQIHGVDRLYYPTGQLYSEYHYTHGDLNGDYTVYFPNGKIMEKGSYKDDEYNGTTQMFGEDGLLSRSLEYRLGYRHGKAILYKEGTIQKEINYWNGVIED